MQPSVLALALLRQGMEDARSEDMLEIAYHIQRHLKVSAPALRPPSLFGFRRSDCEALRGRLKRLTGPLAAPGPQFLVAV